MLIYLVYIFYPFTLLYFTLGETLPSRFTTEMIVAAAMGVPDEYQPRVLTAFATKAWIGTILPFLILLSSLPFPPSFSPPLLFLIPPSIPDFHTYILWGAYLHCTLYTNHLSTLHQSVQARKTKFPPTPQPRHRP